jgi:hypothetical protein
LSEQDYLIVSLHLHFDTYLFSNEYITILWMWSFHKKFYYYA